MTMTVLSRTVTVVLLLAFNDIGHVRASDEALRSRVLKSWQERMNAVQSLKARLKKVVFYPQGAFSAFPIWPGETNRPKTPLPPKDTRFESTINIALDGQKSRICRRDFIFSFVSYSFDEMESIFAYDGHEATILRQCVSNQNDSSGYITSRKKSEGVLFEDWLWLLSVRALDKKVNVALNIDFVEEAIFEERLINNRIWIIATIPRNEQNGEIKIGIDSEKGDMPCWIEIYARDGRLNGRCQVTKSFKDARTNVTFPESWLLAAFHSGSLQSQIECTVLSFQTNVDAADEDFRVKFPAGTRIVDRRDLDNNHSSAQDENSSQPRTLIVKKHYSQFVTWLAVASGIGVVILLIVYASRTRLARFRHLRQ